MTGKKLCFCSLCKGDAFWPQQTVSRHLRDDENRNKLEAHRRRSAAQPKIFHPGPEGSRAHEAYRTSLQRRHPHEQSPETRPAATGLTMPENPSMDIDGGTTSGGDIEQTMYYSAGNDAFSRHAIPAGGTERDPEPEDFGALQDEDRSTSISMSDHELMRALYHDRRPSSIYISQDRETAGGTFETVNEENDPSNLNPDLASIDMENDPLYRSREDIFNPSNDDLVEIATASLHPPAFDEDPILRNIYIRVFVQAAYKGASHDAVRDILRSEKLTLLALQSRGLIPEDLDLSRFPSTLATVERRLGVSPDEYIVHYFICPICWDRHSPSELYLLTTPACTKAGCEGTLFTINGTRDPTGRLKRTPQKILPYSSLLGYVQRMLLRPGKAEEVEHWRTPEDTMAPRSPISRDEWLQLTDGDKELRDIHDGSAWRSIEADIRRVIDADSCTVRTEPKTGSHRLQFVSRRLSLLFTMNVDWMQPIESRVHSTGAVYITVNNLPRHLRSLRENTFLVCVIPGPTEPSLEQMNSVTELVVEEISKLADGLSTPVLQHSQCHETGEMVKKVEEEVVYGDLLNNCSDTPARAKTSGLAGPTTEQHMCSVCWATLSSLTCTKCFDPSQFELRKPESMLFWKLYAESADEEHRGMIAEARGVRFSPLDKRPSWQGALSSPGEPMHMILLGCAATVHKVILVGGGMFVGSRKKNAPQPSALYEMFLDSVWWPAFVTRIPPKLGKGNGKIKADQWRYLLAIYPVALFVAWRDKNDAIPNVDAPKISKAHKSTEKSSNRSNNIVKSRKKKHLACAAAEGEDIDSSDLDEADNSAAERNYRKHFSAVLCFVAAVRIVLTWTITLNEATRAERLFGIAFRSWAAMGCHLTPNFHAVLHIRLWIILFGPVYAWWVYAFERMNGVLARFRTNGRGGGELEATLLRGWLKQMMLQDLVGHMQAIPNATEDDKATTDILLTAMKGGAEGKLGKGTFLSYLAAITPTTMQDGIVFPIQSKTLDLHETQLYTAALHFAKNAIDPDICSYGDRIIPGRRQIQLDSKFKSYSSIHVLGRKYGASKTARGKSLGYAYIQGRQAARIDYFFSLEVYLDREELNSCPKTTVHCAVIRRWTHAPTNMEPPPWEHYATDLGIDLWESVDEDTLPPEVIPVTELEGHFAWAPLQYQGHNLRVTFSLDHRTQEPNRAY